ncbi:MAG: MGMT family protein [Planctomycetota bacterium]|jgi:hypothetical protein
MAKARRTYKSWREKLENPPVELPKVVEVPEKWRKSQGGQYVLVPTPLMADEAIRTVRKGKLITVGQIRQRLARQQKADSTCPMTLGIFLRIISETAEEDRQNGKKCVTPYWRVVKNDGSLNPKFASGVEGQAARLEAEGHTVVPGKGKKPPRVENFEKALV